MGELDEFAPVTDPREYLNAPAMLMMDNGDPREPSQPSKMPLILKAAIDYSGGFDILSADELQQYYAEQHTLERRLADVINRLDIELKMREAAHSISKLHSRDFGGSSDGNRRSSISSARSSALLSTKQGNRLSRFLGQDSHAKSEKRLSKQAAEEAEISVEKIRDLESLRAEIERRKSTVDKTITQHHCAVMARALTEKPLPNHHQRSRSGASAISQGSNRQSWIMAPRHQRQWSSNSNGADSASLATVTEHKRVNRSSTASPAPPLNQLEEEVSSLVVRISQVLPNVSPSPQGKVSYIANAFDSMARELHDARQALEASQIQTEHSQQRIQYLTQSLSEQQKQLENSRSRSADGSRGLTGAAAGAAGLAGAEGVVSKEMQHELELEKSAVTHWRTRAQQQRQQLDTMAKNLEDVTRLAVQLESEHSEFDGLLARLETKIRDLEGEKTELLQQKLRSSGNTSLLCREFQEIVAQLILKHEEEVRSLYPKFSKNRPSAEEYATNLGLKDSVSRGTANAVSTGGDHSAELSEPENGHVEISSERTSYVSAPTTTRNSLYNDPAVAGGQQSRNDSNFRGSMTREYDEQQQPQQQLHQQRADNLSSATLPLAPSKQGYKKVQNTNLNDDEDEDDNFSYAKMRSAYGGGESNAPRKRSSVLAYQSQTNSASRSQQFDQNEDSGELKLPSDRSAHASRAQSEEAQSARSSRLTLPQPYDMSLEDEDSIQHTHDSMMRPTFDRHGSEFSEYSKSSSYYPESQSANQSQVSIASRRPQPLSVPQPYRQFSYENADDEIL